MKGIIFSLALLAWMGVTNGQAQRYDSRIEVAEQAHYGPERAVRQMREDEDRGRWRDRRIGYELERLRREVRRVREEIRFARGGNRRIRDQFARVMRATERINYDFRRGENPLRIRRHIEEARAELYRIQSQLRGSRGPRASR